jgi:hypothetical protein
VLWGHWVDNQNNYRNLLDAAVNRAHQDGLAVYMTLTGAAYDSPLPGQTATTNDNPDPLAYKAWVQEVVGHFKTLGVEMYGLWNEPNNTTFLKSQCNGLEVSRLGTSNVSLYANLWTQGLSGLTAANNAAPGLPKARALFGELSSGRYEYTSSCLPSAPRYSIDMLKYLQQVAQDVPGGVQTTGLAWHPYQMGSVPWHADPAVVGIGRMPQVQSMINTLWHQGHFTAPSGKIPRLFITEFGYWNRPANQSSTSLKLYHTENQRAGWIAGGGSALDLAYGQDARMFLFWEMAERTPAITTNLNDSRNFVNGFDTGFAGAQDSPTALEVGGQRPYGKGPYRDRANPQCRRAYLAVRRWAKGNHYRPAALSPVPGSVAPPPSGTCS